MACNIRSAPQQQFQIEGPCPVTRSAYGEPTVSRYLDLTNSCTALASIPAPMEGGSQVSHGDAQRGTLMQQVLQEASSEEGDMMAGLNSGYVPSIGSSIAHPIFDSCIAFPTCASVLNNVWSWVVSASYCSSLSLLVPSSMTMALPTASRISASSWNQM